MGLALCPLGGGVKADAIWITIFYNHKQDEILVDLYSSTTFAEIILLILSRQVSQGTSHGPPGPLDSSFQ